MRNATNLADWSNHWDHFNIEIYFRILSMKQRQKHIKLQQMKKIFKKLKSIHEYLKWIDEERIKAMINWGRGFN